MKRLLIFEIRTKQNVETAVKSQTYLHEYLK